MRKTIYWLLFAWAAFVTANITTSLISGGLFRLRMSLTGPINPVSAGYQVFLSIVGLLCIAAVCSRVAQCIKHKSVFSPPLNGGPWLAAKICFGALLFILALALLTMAFPPLGYATPLLFPYFRFVVPNLAMLAFIICETKAFLASREKGAF